MEKAQTYRNGKIPGRRGYGIDDAELARLFDSGLEILGIADKMGISQWTVLAHLKKLGLRRTRRHPIARPNTFATMTSGTCYWGGFLAADGFVLSGRNGVGTELSAIDAAHLQTLCCFVGRDDTLMFRRKCQKGKMFEYVRLDIISTKVMADLAKNFGIVPRKSLIIRPPDLPRSLRRHFIRGYFDGDGCVSWRKGQQTIRFCFASGSESFLTWICDTIREETAVASTMTISKRKCSQTRVFELYGDAAVKVLEWMYSDGGDALCLKRKREKFLECKERLNTRRAARADKRQATTNRMVSLYDQGLSYSEIAERLSATKEKVSYYLRQTDTPKRSRKTDSLAGQRLRARDQEMLSAHLAGESVEGIAGRFGMVKSNVWVALRRAKGSRTGQTGQG